VQLDDVKSEFAAFRSAANEEAAQLRGQLVAAEEKQGELEESRAAAAAELAQLQATVKEVRRGLDGRRLRAEVGMPHANAPCLASSAACLFVCGRQRPWPESLQAWFPQHLSRPYPAPLTSAHPRVVLTFTVQGKAAKQTLKLSFEKIKVLQGNQEEKVQVGD